LQHILNFHSLFEMSINLFLFPDFVRWWLETPRYLVFPLTSLVSDFPMSMGRIVNLPSVGSKNLLGYLEAQTFRDFKKPVVSPKAAGGSWGEAAQKTIGRTPWQRPDQAHQPLTREVDKILGRFWFMISVTKKPSPIGKRKPVDQVRSSEQETQKKALKVSKT